MDFSDDIWGHVLSFIPSLRLLGLFAQTHRRAHYLVQHSPVAQPAFRQQYFQRYNQTGGGKDELKSIHALSRMFFVKGSSTTIRQQLPTVQLDLFTEQQTEEARQFDRGIQPQDKIFMGYFGMGLLFNSNKNSGPIAVWGDFDGIRVFDSIESLMNKNDDCISVGIEEEEAVLTMIPHPIQDTIYYLGFASGSIWQVRMNKKGDTGRHLHECIAKAKIHSNEVTSLRFAIHTPLVSCSLISASVDGTVFQFAGGDLSNYPERIGSLSSPILSLDSVEHSDGQHLIVTGDDKGYVSLWKRGEDDNTSWGHRFCRVPGNNAITDIKFCPSKNGDLFVVAGDNAGKLTMFQVDDLLELDLKECFGPRSATRSAPVETIRAVDSMLLVAAGSNIQCYHLPWTEEETLLRHLGTFQASAQTSLLSLVIRHNQQHLVGLARDGSVYSWSYDHRLEAPAEQAQGRKRKRGSSQSVAKMELNEQQMSQSAARMKIILQAFQYHLGDKNSAVDDDRRVAYEKRSGVVSCQACQGEDASSFVCRVQRKHLADMNVKDNVTKLHQRLKSTSRVKKMMTKGNEDSWTCQRCFVDNFVEFKRCFVCRKWYNHPLTKRKSHEKVCSDASTKRKADEKPSTDSTVAWPEP